MRKCRGGACPYMAAWLIHTNLYKRMNWYLRSTKMEEAAFRVFDDPSLKYQLVNPDLYFVHHMSEFEHQIHKKHGIDRAKNVTSIMSHAAYNGECNRNIDTINSSSNYIAFIPFYGGLPPDVNNKFEVKSIGQGNSLVIVT